jgi:prevent-host-death family protein
MYIVMYTWTMPKTYSVAEARAHLPDILDEVAAGREVQLTRRGAPAAVVISVDTYEALRGESLSFRDTYRAFLERHSSEELALDRAFVDALRDRRPARKVRL